jgi:hypothetical protein
MFCPACATAIEPGLAACPSCGEPLPVIRGAVPAAVIGSPPAAVRTAIKVLWAAVGIGLFTLAVTVITLASRVSNLPRLLAPSLLIAAVWVLAIVFTARRTNIARILVFLLVAYSAFNLLIRLRLFVVQANPGALVAFLELGLRIYAVYLLLRPESNQWFATNTSGTG